MTVVQKNRRFRIGNAVFVKNQISGAKWTPGQIQEVRCPVIYTVLLQDSHVMKRHVDQIVLLQLSTMCIEE